VSRENYDRKRNCADSLHTNDLDGEQPYVDSKQLIALDAETKDLAYGVSTYDFRLDRTYGCRAYCLLEDAMKRTSIWLSEQQVKLLAKLSKQTGIKQAELIRRFIDGGLATK
jgi:hypothetical protein